MKINWIIQNPLNSIKCPTDVYLNDFMKYKILIFLEDKRKITSLKFKNLDKKRFSDDKRALFLI